MTVKSAMNFPRQSETPTFHQVLFVVFCLAGFLRLAGEPSWAEELQTVKAIRELPLAQTQQNIPAHLRGVVTFFDERLFSYFIQDETAGIYLQFPTNVGPPALLPGQLVEVTGTCSPGEYAPVLVVDRLQAVGEVPLPAPKVVTYEQLASGVEDSQFVEITGIVRSARLLEDSQYFLIEIATGGGRLLVYAKELPVEKTEELLDSTLRVRGVCSTLFNHERQLFSIRLMVPRPEDLEIKVPAPPNPFTMTARPIGSLLQFAPQETYGHRFMVMGTVTYYVPGKTLFLQEGKQGIEVLTKEKSPLQLGDRVKALGWVSQGEYSPLLQDAIFQKISSGQPATPAVLTPNEVLKGNHDDRLIQLTAQVLDHTQNGSEQYLILQSDGFVFHAYLKRSEGKDAFVSLANGSLVAVTGVCQIDPGEWQAGEAWRAKGFNIKLRSRSDVVLLKYPSWWTLRKVLWMTGVLGFAALAAFGWVAVLHRQVAERTRQLEIQIQERQRADRRREIEQERSRVAHDLHDDLGAGLTEVNMLTSLAKSPTTTNEEKMRYLDDLAETARRMVTSLDEIVWAVNPHNDTIASLASYFGSYAQRLLNLAGVFCGLDIAEDLPEYSLDPKFRQEIFFAVKEALTNVVRHAHATQVWLHISVSHQQLVVEVVDDGRGLGISECQPGSDGLVNMNERLKTLGGRCEIVSDAKTGTTVRFFAPLPPKIT
jgi:signal transduction histidine kinase